MTPVSVQVEIPDEAQVLLQVEERVWFPVLAEAWALSPVEERVWFPVLAEAWALSPVEGRVWFPVLAEAWALSQIEEWVWFPALAEAWALSQIEEWVWFPIGELALLRVVPRAGFRALFQSESSVLRGAHLVSVWWSAESRFWWLAWAGRFQAVLQVSPRVVLRAGSQAALWDAHQVSLPTFRVLLRRDARRGTGRHG